MNRSYPSLTKYPLLYSTGTLDRFWSNFKIRKKSNFDQNQLKLSMQHKKMYMYQKKL